MLQHVAVQRASGAGAGPAPNAAADDDGVRGESGDDLEGRGGRVRLDLHRPHRYHHVPLLPLPPLLPSRSARERKGTMAPLGKVRRFPFFFALFSDLSVSFQRQYREQTSTYYDQHRRYEEDYRSTVRS